MTQAVDSMDNTMGTKNANKHTRGFFCYVKLYTSGRVSSDDDGIYLCNYKADS